MGLKQKKRAIGAVRVVVVCFLMTSLGPIDISSRCGKFNMPEMDPDIMKKSGRVHMTAELAKEYGFKDVDGQEIPSMRTLYTILSFSGYTRLASWVPRCIKLPYWMMALAGNKF